MSYILAQTKVYLYKEFDMQTDELSNSSLRTNRFVYIATEVNESSADLMQPPKRARLESRAASASINHEQV